jgi:mannose-6-phosphate isomerase-like protein (cupin superfamily)
MAPAKPAPAAAPSGQTSTTGTGTTKPRSTTGTRTTTPAPAARSGITLNVADMSGRSLQGVRVDVDGPTTRRDETNASGQANFASMQAGTYRLTFSGDHVTTFEREVTLTPGKISNFDIALNPAPPPREIIKEVAPAAPPPAPVAVVGPPGQAQLTSLYDIAETELKSRTPRREMLVACSGNLRTTMILLADKEQTSLPKRMYDSAEVSYYVLGGEATVQVGETVKNLAAGGYAAVPRGTPVTIARKGNKPLSLLSVLSGEPCEEAK